MNKIKRYFKSHPGATIEDYNNQKHRMHIIQAKTALERNSGFGLFKGKHVGSNFGLLKGKHVGSKKNKTLLAIIKSVCNQ